jgi:hypothetical protein
MNRLNIYLILHGINLIVKDPEQRYVCGIPREVAGSIDFFHYDPLADLFNCSWMEDGTESRPSTFTLPGITHRDSLDIKLVPNGNGFELELQNGGNSGGILKIKPVGKPSKRKLLITFTNLILNNLIMRTVKLLMLVLIVAGTSSLYAQKKVDPAGTWTYSAPDAPYEYNTGDIVIDKDGNELTVKIKLGDYYEVKGQNVALEEDQLTFTVYIEGESVSIKGTVGKEEIEGTASYSEGTIRFKAKKKK